MMADGMRFVDPNLIYVGWVLVLPGLPSASPTEPTPTDPMPSLSLRPPASKLVPAPNAHSPRADGQRGGSGLGESGPGQTKAASAPTTNPASAQPRRVQAGVGAPGEAGALNGAEAAVPVGGDALTGAVVRLGTRVRQPRNFGLGRGRLSAPHPAPTRAGPGCPRRRRSRRRPGPGRREARSPSGPFCRRAGARVARARQPSSHLGAAG